MNEMQVVRLVGSSGEHVGKWNAGTCKPNPSGGLGFEFCVFDVG